MAATDVIHVDTITATTASVYTGHEDAGARMDFTIYASDGTTVVKSVSASDPGWGVSRITVSGLTPNTTYVAKLDGEPSVSATFTTLADSPKVATESMWADLASKVKAKADSTSLAAVATSGSYNDLSNKPTIPSVVSDVGSSTTSVMSQSGATRLIWSDDTSRNSLLIGSKSGVGTVSQGSIRIGTGLGGEASSFSVAIGYRANKNNSGTYSVALGGNSESRYNYGVALGAYSTTTAGGEASFGGPSLGTNGYNGSQYRLLTNIYDPQGAHDAATKGYVDASNSYSTTETATGGTWIDGSPIYRRAFTGTITNTAGTRAAVTLWASSPIAKLIDQGGWAQYGSGSSRGERPVPMSEDTVAFQEVYLQAGSNDLIFHLNDADSLTDRQYEVWVEYTKSS